MMVAVQPDIPGVCWPIDLIRNKAGEFVGYVMNEARGSRLQIAVFYKSSLQKYFPSWKRQNLVQLCIEILIKIKKLHEIGVILGDINPLNILVESDTSVYFVDTDSYQIGSYPCVVGMVNFTAPEAHGKDYKSYLRTMEMERFAVATLLFMILLPGKPPFSHLGGGDPGENIKVGNFSYPFGGRTNKKTPDGPWRFIWSHLPYRTKDAFYKCFNENVRPTDEQWLTVMESYLHAINNHRMCPKDGNSMFPSLIQKS